MRITVCVPDSAELIICSTHLPNSIRTALSTSTDDLPICTSTHMQIYTPLANKDFAHRSTMTGLFKKTQRGGLGNLFVDKGVRQSAIIIIQSTLLLRLPQGCNNVFTTLLQPWQRINLTVHTYIHTYIHNTVNFA